MRTREALRRQLQQVPLGLPHYSYAIVCQKFLTLLDNMNVQATELLMPEIYPSGDSVLQYHIKTKPIHLMFKAFDEFRLLKGAHNIAHVAWEYSCLPTFTRMPLFHAKRAHPLNDFAFALSLLDEIWVGCSFTRDVLLREGLSRVHLIPAPVELALASPSRLEPGFANGAFMSAPLQIVECRKSVTTQAQIEIAPSLPGEALFMRIAEIRSRGGKVFLSIFNPHDPRKNPAAALNGFQRFCQQQHRDDLLIVKILVDGKINTFHDVLRVIMPRRFGETMSRFDLIDSENILIFCGTMSEAELDRLYRAADFYLCTSNAEGQNLPLLEAMARGVVPVSPATTAMADYVNEDNSIVLKATETAIHENAASAYGLFDAHWYEVAASEVARGLAKAVSYDMRALNAKRTNAIRTVAEKYSWEAVAPLIEQRLAALGHFPLARETSSWQHDKTVAAQ
jgi:glycosyltransferase involved in cell wall biosynthesis